MVKLPCKYYTKVSKTKIPSCIDSYNDQWYQTIRKKNVYFPTCHHSFWLTLGELDWCIPQMEKPGMTTKSWDQCKHKSICQRISLCVPCDTQRELNNDHMQTIDMGLMNEFSMWKSQLSSSLSVSLTYKDIQIKQIYSDFGAIQN